VSGIDFEELLQSPLDEPRGARGEGWWPAIVGLVVGLIGSALLTSFVRGTGGEDEEALPTTTQISTTEAPANEPPQALDYPAGYEEIAAGVAAKPSEVIFGTETITVALTTVVKRDMDPLDNGWPLGGRWRLEAPDGAVADSIRVILGRSSPGAFAIEFPSGPFAGETSFSLVRMVERWDHSDVSGSVDLPFGGEPFVAPDPVTVRLTDEVTLTIPRLELGRFLGRVDWALHGAGPAGGRVLVNATLLDAGGDRIGAYSSFPVLLVPSDSGTTELRWQEPFPISPDGGVTVVLDYMAALVEEVVTDITVDLTGVPIGQ